MRFTLPFFITCFFIIVFQQSFAQCPSPVAVSINNIITTESRCNTSGTATIEISNGAAPFTYSIISGPVLASPQAGNLFQALSQGNYIVQVTDNCNESVTQSFTIIGSYEEPEMTINTQSPSCPGSNDGRITVDITKGREPFSYALISPSPLTAGPQSSNIFTGLISGNYTCQITDSCNNFQTRNFTLLDGTTQNLFFSNQTFRWQACDSFAFGYTMGYYNFSPLHFPITAQFTIGGNTITHILTDISGTNLKLDTFRFKYVHVKGAFEPFSITITDVCGNTYTYSDQLNSYLGMYPVSYQISGCSRQLTYKLDDMKDNSNPLSSLTPHCSTITYTLKSPAGNTLISQINNSTFTGYPPGNGYKIIREDCCRKDSILFDWQEVPPLSILYDLSPQYSCKENTTGLRLFANINTFISPLTFVLVNGPASITFTDGTINNYTYRDTLVKKDPTGGMILNYLTTGTYTFEVTDTCGQVNRFDIVVKPSDLRHSSIATKIIKGCVNDNKITFTTKSNTGAFFAPSPTPAYVDITEISSFNKTINKDDYTDSAVNLAPGTYHLNYHYDNPWRQASLPIIYAKGMENIHCDSIIYTTVVPDYTQPIFTTPLAIAVCNETRNVALLPDSSRGVPPYEYQITAGPITTAMQSSPVFPNLIKGVYTFRMADFCGNSYSSSIAIDTLILPDIATIGDPCKGGSVIFKAPSSPYYFYLWERPNGNISIKDTLMINQIADTDTGYYKLTIISLINGCSDSKTRLLHFNYCLPVPVKLVSFNGFIKDNKAVLSWQTTNEMNAAYFYIEHSTDGIHFTSLQKINAANSNNNSYTYLDERNLKAVNFYRLAQYDKDGKINYSGIIRISSAGYESITVGPNPAKNVLNIQWQTEQKANSSITITDMSGKLLLSKNVALAKGNNLITLPIHLLATGTYITTLKNGFIVKSMKFIKK